MTPRANERTVLDRLLETQLLQIVEAESQLHQQYSLLLQAQSNKGWEHWAADVCQLDAQADRFCRMLDALDGSYSKSPIREKRVNLAA